MLSSPWTVLYRSFIAAIGDSGQQGEPVGGSPPRPSAEDTGRVCRQENVNLLVIPGVSSWPGASIAVLRERVPV